ncbi:hypothetical protein BC828DRAFT_394970 [Blastocladiella britannica]|nr:hypothetical protein BC828DRAFT_394970 [Blastocladiella britannica]
MDPANFPEDVALDFLDAFQDSHRGNGGDGDQPGEDDPAFLDRLEHLQSATDYYALLNVSRTAEPDRIKDAFKQLARVYHPDKHPDPAARAAAESQFLRIQKAFEVLSDHTARTLYDLYGAESPELAQYLASAASAQANDRQVGHLLKTPDDVRKEYEERLRRENLHKLEALIRQRGEVTIALDATPILAGALSDPPTVGQVDLRSLQVKYSTDTPVSDTLVLGLSGRMLTQQSRGVGTLKAHVRNTFSRHTSGELAVGLLAPHATSAKLRTVVHEASDTTAELDLQWPRFVHTAPPTAAVTVTRRLAKNRPIFGIVRLCSGTYSIGGWGKGSLAEQIARAADGGNARQLALSKDSVTSFMVAVQWNHAGAPPGTMTSASLSTSMFEQTFALRHVRKLLFLAGKTPLSTSSSSSSSSSSAHAGAPILDLSTHMDTRTGAMGFTWKLTARAGEHAKLGMGASIATGVGTVFTAELGYLGQRLSIPIALYPEPVLTVLAVATAVPLAAAAAAWWTLVEPRRRRLWHQKLADAKLRAAGVLAQRRTDALAAREAMRATVAAKYARERAAARPAAGGRGLVVVQALYGTVRARAARLGASDRPGAIVTMDANEHDGVIDVTIPVMALVKDAALRIEGGGSKAGMLGFWDPAPFEDKQLVITYRFKDEWRQVVVEDNAAVACPLRAHLVITDPQLVVASPDMKELHSEATTQ